MLNRLRNLSFVLATMILLACVLSACVTRLPSPQAMIGPKQRVSFLETQAAWSLQGHFSVTSALGKTQNGSYHWQQCRDDLQLHLYAAFHVAEAVLMSNPKQTVLSQGGKQYRAASPEKLLTKVLQLQLPVADLRYWLRGLAAPGVTITQPVWRNGLLQSFSQKGWQVHYLRYQTFQQMSMPRLMTLQQGKHWRVRISAKDWHFAHGC